MTYRGHVKNGVVLFNESVSLPDGTEVQVTVAPSPAVPDETGIPTLFEQLKLVIGKAKGLPDDLAKNHDYYLHGLPKK